MALTSVRAKNFVNGRKSAKKSEVFSIRQSIRHAGGPQVCPEVCPHAATVFRYALFEAFNCV